MQATHLYFIALIPPEAIAQEVQAFKLLAAEKFHTRRALRSPAHITLFPPFRLRPAEDLERLTLTLKAFAARQKTFLVGLHGFAAFRPRVIYVDIVPNDRLTELQTTLEEILAESMELENPSAHGFHPHMTIAFKDLTRSRFPEAWAYFSQQNYYRSFTVDTLYLLQHEPAGWKVSGQFAFGEARQEP